MEIRSVEFVVSNSDVKKCPEHELPEYAFIGRSNVGKSSLINMMTHSKIAKTSSTPGKTQLINHFFINKSWYLVDLPGYGYARGGKSLKEQLTVIINNYILKRKELTCLFVLLDSRLEPQNIDVEFLILLGEHQIPFHLIFTKADKLSKTQLEQSITVYKETLGEYWDPLPPYLITSSENKTGKKELLEVIDTYNATVHN